MVMTACVLADWLLTRSSTCTTLGLQFIWQNGLGAGGGSDRSLHNDITKRSVYIHSITNGHVEVVTSTQRNARTALWNVFTILCHYRSPSLMQKWIRTLTRCTEVHLYGHQICTTQQSTYVNQHGKLDCPVTIYPSKMALYVHTHYTYKPCTHVK